MQNNDSTIKVWTDLDHNLKFERELLEIDGKRLSVADGKERISLDLDEIDKSYIEEGLGIGKLVIRTRKGKELEVAYFTKDRAHEFKRLAIALSEYKDYG